VSALGTRLPPAQTPVPSIVEAFLKLSHGRRAALITLSIEMQYETGEVIIQRDRRGNYAKKPTPVKLMAEMNCLFGAATLAWSFPVGMANAADASHEFVMVTPGTDTAKFARTDGTPVTLASDPNVMNLLVNKLHSVIETAHEQPSSERVIDLIGKVWLSVSEEIGKGVTLTVAIMETLEKDIFSLGSDPPALRSFSPAAPRSLSSARLPYDRGRSSRDAYYDRGRASRDASDSESDDKPFMVRPSTPYSSSKPCFGWVISGECEAKGGDCILAHDPENKRRGKKFLADLQKKQSAHVTFKGCDGNISDGHTSDGSQRSRSEGKRRRGDRR